MSRDVEEVMEEVGWICWARAFETEETASVKTLSWERANVEWQEVRWERQAGYIMQASRAIVGTLGFVLSITRSRLRV